MRSGWQLPQRQSAHTQAARQAPNNGDPKAQLPRTHLEAHNEALHLLHMRLKISFLDGQLPIATEAQHVLKLAVPCHTVAALLLIQQSLQARTTAGGIGTLALARHRAGKVAQNVAASRGGDRRVRAVLCPHSHAYYAARCDRLPARHAIHTPIQRRSNTCATHLPWC